MLSLHLDLPSNLAAVITERAAAQGTTPELYVLALVQRVLLEDTLAPRHRGWNRRLSELLADGVSNQATH